MILPSNFIPGLPFDRTPTDQAAAWYIFHRAKLLVTSPDESGGTPELPSIARAEELIAPGSIKARRYLGALDGLPCFAAEVESDQAPPGYRFEPVRALFNRVDDVTLAVAGRAVQMIEFGRTHRFCGACATPTAAHENGNSLRCPSCGEIAYPRVAPAMMVLIKRDLPTGRELLLARSGRFPGKMYSALAGFVEPSESIEDCIHREAFEEVGVRVKNLRYFESQGWPFPHSLMIAFVADYESGEIVCQEGEIEDAQWFPLDALPQLPHRLSIARRLIDATTV